MVMFIYISSYSQATVIKGEIGLICWGIVIHSFINGYSQPITGLCASNNNLGDTILNLFLTAVCTYGVPSHIRGDHGIKNIPLAAWMELYQGGQ